MCARVCARALPVARVLYCNTPIVARTVATEDDRPVFGGGRSWIKYNIVILFFETEKKIIHGETLIYTQSHYRQLRRRVHLSRPPRAHEVVCALSGGV